MGGGSTAPAGGATIFSGHTNAVAHPRAVVVELGDAAVAHGAVLGPDGLPYL